MQPLPAPRGPFLSVQDARSIDERAVREYGMSSLVLMENAGRGCVDLLERLGIRGPVVVCCGKGNNAGDGFVIARHLELRGYPVNVLVCTQPESLRGDAAANFGILQRAGARLAIAPDKPDPAWLADQLRGADWIVDALLGTGVTGSPRPPLDAVIAAVNQSASRKLAVDVPSGLDSDRGIPSESTVRADHTATFVAAKQGFRAAAAFPYLGTVHVLDIGVPRKLVEEILTASLPAGTSERSVS
jgi:NAD(P)H-hydrate epimerase